MSEINVACGKLLQRYLMASYLYYCQNQSVMPDEEFDQIGKVLLKYYDQFEHQHKHLVTKGDLEAGTLFALPSDGYPLLVQHAAERWLRGE